MNGLAPCAKHIRLGESQIDTVHAEWLQDSNGKPGEGCAWLVQDL